MRERLLARSITVDGRIERRLTEISSALTDKKAAARRMRGPARYCDRLNWLVSAVLVESKAGRV